jgi:hypothetical protein
VRIGLSRNTAKLTLPLEKGDPLPQVARGHLREVSYLMPFAP